MRVRHFDAIIPQIVDTTENWDRSAIVIKPEGILLLEKTSDGKISKMKISNGKNTYRDLDYVSFGSGSGGGGSIGGSGVVPGASPNNIVVNPPVTTNFLKTLMK